MTETGKSARFEQGMRTRRAVLGDADVERDDVREAMLHVAVYAGAPAANNAIRIAKKVFGRGPAPEW